MVLMGKNWWESWFWPGDPLQPWLHTFFQGKSLVSMLFLFDLPTIVDVCIKAQERFLVQSVHLFQNSYKSFATIGCVDMERPADNDLILKSSKKRGMDKLIR